MSEALKILFATPEIAPWQKTGGLGDVAAALPKALRAAGADVRLLLPAYPALLAAFPDAVAVAALPSPGGLLPGARLLETTTAGGMPLLLIDCPALYDRPGGPYQSPAGIDWPDNALRFGLLSQLAAVLSTPASPLAWRPDVLHCNDWQTALAPACLHYLHGDAGAASVMTIHNLAFQGLFAAPTLADLGLPAAAFVFDGVEFHDQLSFLKAGLQFADRLTTVSPTYALEIQEAELGFGLDGLLRYRRDDLTGILNGIDAAWDPATDPHLAQRYDARRLTAKSFNRRALRGEFALPDDEAVPLLAVVSRLTAQKGIDLILAIADQLLELPAQLVILGSGEHAYEADCRALAVANPGRVAVTIGFDEALAHRIEAGADIFLMPSRFEPCGLNQMYSLRYGTPPVVRATGGLADTVIDAGLAHGNGFSFAEAEPAPLLEAVGRAVAAWRKRRRWPRLQRAGMGADFSWSGAAAAYLDVYRAAMRHHAACSNAADAAWPLSPEL